MTSTSDEEDDDFDWHEFNAWMKERHKAHVARNMKDYRKYLFQMEKLGFSEIPQGAGHRFIHPIGLRIDFWRQSGKWTVVGTNIYNLGPRKMVKEAERLIGVNTSAPTEVPSQPADCPRKYEFTLKPMKYSEPQDNDDPPWEI